MWVSLSISVCRKVYFITKINVRTLLSSSCKSEGEGLEKEGGERRKEKDEFGY